MEIRKLQLAGGTTFTVTLPKSWVTQVGLQAGDLLGMRPLPDGTIAIVPFARPIEARKPEEVWLASDDNLVVQRALVSRYVDGHDLILAGSRDGLSPMGRKAILQAARRLLGVQVIDEDDQSILLEDMLDPIEYDIEKALRRMAAIQRMIARDLLRDLDGSTDAPPRLDERLDEGESLMWLAMKRYHSGLRKRFAGGSLSFHADRDLRAVLVTRTLLDDARHLADVRSFLGSEKPKSKGVREDASAVCSLLHRAVDAYHQKHAENALHLIRETDERHARGKGADRAPALWMRVLVRDAASIASIAYWRAMQATNDDLRRPELPADAATPVDEDGHR